MVLRGAKQGSGRAARSNNTAAGSKSSTRGGGIRKRRVGAVDLDGDLSMDSAGQKRQRGGAGGPSSSKGRGESASSVANRLRGPSKTAQNVIKHLSGQSGRSTRSRDQKLTWLRVRGLKTSKAASNADGGLGDLEKFLERKASGLISGPKRRDVRIRKTEVAGDYVFIGASKEDADEILKVNTFQFAGTNLEVVESTDDLAVQSKVMESEETQQLRAMLQDVLGQRYMGESKLLKLDALATDPSLVNLGMFESPERALKTFKGLMAICDGLFKTAQEKQEAIESISLASNNIDNIAQVEMVATTFPQLQNLDLSGNQIASMQALEKWKGKLRHMVTLYIARNPIEAADPAHQATLLEWFPKLQIINGVQVRTPEQIAEKAAASKPKPIPQSGPDFRDVDGIGENFLLNFFLSYDENRVQLAGSLYDDESQFSLAVDTRSARDPNAPAPLPWSSYIKFSRNLMKVTTAGARIQRLFRGGNVIADIWRKLPVTKHPNIKDDLTKWIMDCHRLGCLPDPSGQSPTGIDGMALTVHGEFEEYDQVTKTRGKRSFSRSFILGPGKPGGPTIRVVSDMLSLRAFSPLPNVFEPQAQAHVAQPAPEQGQAQQQQAMLEELCRQTGMTPAYSQMCLEQVQWNFDQALSVFHEKRAQLPPDAFVQSQ